MNVAARIEKRLRNYYLKMKSSSSIAEIVLIFSLLLFFAFAKQ